MKVRSADYQSLVSDAYIPGAVAALGPNFVFQQDGAPSHTSKSTKEFLQGKHQISEVLQDAASSPDLTPMDFAVWSRWSDIASRIAANMDIRSDDDLKAVVVAAHAQLVASSGYADWVSAILVSFEKRFQKCIAVDGAHFEHTL